jgi:endoglucanase
MNSETVCMLAERLMVHPAAPYHEHAVRDEVEKICAENDLPFRRDRFGNVLVTLQTTKRARPVALAAHLDHPGFEIVRRQTAVSWHARFRGGVPEEYFKPGVRLRLMPGATPAKLARGTGRKGVFEVRCGQPPAVPPEFAVWDLEDFRRRHTVIYGRACDDLIGVTSILATLIELKRTRARTHVLGLISRAEEVGFHGALALAAAGEVPRNALVISLETSRQLPGVKMGEGVILRVGDRTSVFDPEAMLFLGEVAAELKKKRRGFKFQRALMTGGTCEATAYQQSGLQTGGLCVALGNYHNCGEQNYISAEYVNIPDVCGMIDLLIAASGKMAEFPKLVARLGTRLLQLRREAEKNLPRTATK